VLGGSLKAELVQLGEADEAARKALEADWQKRHEAVVASGGLHIVGTERHESPGASTTSCAAAPAARATGLEPLLPVARRQPDADLRRPGAHQALGSRLRA